jgi:LemA protein
VQGVFNKQQIKKNMWITIIVLVVVAVLIAFWLMGMYNGLVKSRNRYKNAFSQIDVQLKRRYDLIPNLVETAKSYMKHESETLEAVIRARNSANDARKSVSPDDSVSMGALAAAETSLGSSMGSFIGLSESYPDLKSNQNMMQLTEELTTTENKVGFSRQSYNDSVTMYNNKCETFPSSIFAGMFNFNQAVLFEVADDKERESVKVSF